MGSGCCLIDVVSLPDPIFKLNYGITDHQSYSDICLNIHNVFDPDVKFALLLPFRSAKLLGNATNADDIGLPVDFEL